MNAPATLYAAFQKRSHFGGFFAGAFAGSEEPATSVFHASCGKVEVLGSKIGWSASHAALPVSLVPLARFRVSFGRPAPPVPSRPRSGR
jgi:hypothetical protein